MLFSPSKLYKSKQKCFEAAAPRLLPQIAGRGCVAGPGRLQEESQPYLVRQGNIFSELEYRSTGQLKSLLYSAKSLPQFLANPNSVFEPL